MEKITGLICMGLLMPVMAFVIIHQCKYCLKYKLKITMNNNVINTLNKFFKICIFIAAFIVVNPVFSFQKSLVFECNEEANVIGMVESFSNFGADYDRHLGWKSGEANDKYRTWAIPSGATIRTFEWKCKIQSKTAALKILHKITPKDALIEKYGNKYENCGATRVISLSFSEKILLNDILIESNGCDVAVVQLHTIFFTQLPRSTKLLKSGYRIQGHGYPKDFIIDIDIDLNRFFYSYQDSSKAGSKNTVEGKLPLTNAQFTELLLRK